MPWYSIPGKEKPRIARMDHESFVFHSHNSCNSWLLLHPFDILYTTAVLSIGRNWSLVGSAQQNQDSVKRGGRNLSGSISGILRREMVSPCASYASSRIL